MTNKYTMSTPLYEDRAKTIVNRLGQKSISLPRITDDKRMRGYPGLAGTAKAIADILPTCKYYVEPFAGTAKVYQELNRNKYTYAILNDKSPFVYEWLMREFNKDPMTYVYNADFVPIMERFSVQHKALFLIDAPWHREIYLQKYSCFDRETVKEYDEQILEMCRHMNAKFVICSDRKNPRMLKSGFRNKLIEGEYKVAGGNVKTLITTNIEGIL